MPLQTTGRRDGPSHVGTHKEFVPPVRVAPRRLVEALLSQYPGLQTVEGGLALTVHLLTTPDVEPPSRTIPMPYEALGVIGGFSESDIKDGNRATGDLLVAVSEALAAGGTRLEIIEHSQPRHQATRLRLHDVPPLILEAATDAVGARRVLPGSWVWLRPEGFVGLTKRSVRGLRREFEETGYSIHEGTPDTTRRLLKYLNGHDIRTFRPLAEAAGSRRTWDFVEREVAPEKRGRARLILKEIEAIPIPLYHAAPVTPRVHARYQNVTTLSSDVRQFLTREVGWIEVDMAHSQLSANARRWRVNRAQELLGGEEYCFWDDLFDHLGADPAALGDAYDPLKRVMKEVVYGIAYGMGIRRIHRLGAEGATIEPDVRALVEETCGRPAEEVARRISTHQILGPMLRRRDELYAIIKRQGGWVDVFGRTLPLRDGNKKPNPGALLAVDSQAIELRMLEPVIDLAIRERDTGQRGFQIVVWQHDGFTISVRSSSRRKLWVTRLGRLVADQAQRVGVPTSLKVATGLSGS